MLVVRDFNRSSPVCKSGTDFTSALVFAYIGFDIVATAAEETKNPQRDIPIGIFSLGICTVQYVGVACGDGAW